MGKVRVTIIGVTAAMALAMPGMANAQIRGGRAMGNGIDSGQLPLPQDIRPMGTQMGRGHGTPAYIEGDQCETLGCMIVVNKSQTFEVTQLYINDGKTDARGVPDWGANQFQGFSLDPARAVWTVKPRKMKCEMVVRIVLRNPQNNEEVESIQPLNMCNMPKGGFAVVGVQGDGPRVILESGS